MKFLVIILTALVSFSCSNRSPIEEKANLNLPKYKSILKSVYKTSIISIPAPCDIQCLLELEQTDKEIVKSLYSDSLLTKTLTLKIDRYGVFTFGVFRKDLDAYFLHYDSENTLSKLKKSELLDLTKLEDKWYFEHFRIPTLDVEPDIKNEIKTSVDSSKVISILDKTRNTRTEDSLREDYYGFDSLLINDYVTDNGNRILLKGSKSGDPYIIEITSSKGINRKYQMADNWYLASHSSVKWDNSDYVFINSGCGTSCWSGIAVSLTSDKVQYFDSYLSVDSISNIIVYPDTSNFDNLIVEQMVSKKNKTIELKLCNETPVRVNMFEYVNTDQNGEMIVIYKSEECKEVVKDFFDISEIYN